MATATTESVRLSPGPRLPKMLQGIAFVTATHGLFAALARRCGGRFTVNLPVFGQTVVSSDPNLARDLFALAWAVERIRRHPQLLLRLTEETDAGGSELRQAAIYEVQRIRPVIDGLSRRTIHRIRLSDWVIPEDTTVTFSIWLAHAFEQSFPGSASFNPDRFVGAVPNPFEWIPFGGVNRCIGAALANMEMDVTLRTLLRELRFAPTDAPAERRHSRGVTTAPAWGGRAVVYRRATEASRDADSASTADYGTWRLGSR
jgi:Cytochrome P450